MAIKGSLSNFYTNQTEANAPDFGFGNFAAERKKVNQQQEKETNRLRKIQQTIDTELDKGSSYEFIAKNTGLNLEDVRQYADTTRPGYGVRQPARPSLFSSLTSQVQRIGTGLGELISGAPEREARAFRETQQSLINTINLARQKSRDTSLSAAERQRWSNLERQTTSDLDRAYGARAVEEERIRDVYDPRKMAGAIVETGLLAATPVLGRAAGVGRLSTMSRGQLARAAGVGAAEGVVGGAAIGLQEDRPTLSSVARTAATGGLLGGAIPVAGAGLGRGTRAARTGLQQLDTGAAKVIDRLSDTVPGQRVQDAFTTVQQKIQKSTAPLTRPLQRAIRENKLSKQDVEIVEGFLQDTKTSRSQAQKWLEEDPDAQRVLAPMDNRALGGKAQQRLDDYINTQNELNLMRIDGKTNTNRYKQFQNRLAELESPELRERYQADVAVNRKLTDMLVKEGIVTPEQAARWRATNSEYIRIQRLVDDLSEFRPRGGGSKASAKRTIAEQRRKGSTKQALSAVETMIDRTNRVFDEMYINRAANALINAYDTAGILGKQIRNADDVFIRQTLRESLALSRPLKRQLERVVRSQGQYIRRIQSEIRQLERQAKGTVEKGLRRATKQALVPETGPELENITAVIEDILTTDAKTFNRLNKKWATRDKKLSTAIREMQDLKEQLDGLNAQRKLEFQEILQRGDEAARNRPTIHRYRNGVKETFITTPEIEAAAKGLGPAYIGALGRAISAPTRFMQSTITGGLNPVWVAISIPRDFIEGLVLSSKARATHHPANVVGSIADMVGGEGKKLFDEFMASERGVSSIIDLTRNAKSNAEVIRKLSRAQMPPVKRAVDIIKTPKDWYGILQDISKWNEYFAKYMNFRGVFNDAMRRKIPREQAFILGVQNGRRATGNLLETGDFTRPLQAVYPYFNPSIQGGAALARAFKTRPATTSLKILTAVQMPAAIATAWNLSDPRRAEIYLDISPSERERYNIVVLPGTEKSEGRWQVVKLPKAPGVGALANPVERLMLAMYGKDATGFENFAQSFLKAAGSPFDVGSVSGFVGSTLPFQIRTGVELAANKNFYADRPIIPDWLMEEDEPYKRAYESTSKTYKSIGKALNISPLFVEQFMKNTTGEFGQNVTYASDVAFERFTEQEGGVAGRSLREGLTQRFFGAYGGQEQRRFRDELDDTIEDKRPLSKSVTEAIKRNDIGEANRIANEYNQRIDGLLELVRSRGEFVQASEAQQEYLESLKFPLSNGRLSELSIKSRQKQ